jgi:hypothetical protein
MSNPSRILSTLSQVNDRRGYLVLSRDEPVPIGYIFPGIILLGDDQEERVEQPLRVMESTNRADWEAQQELANVISGETTRAVAGRFFYRVRTD